MDVQPLLIRPFFRVVGALLGIAFIAGGAAFCYIVLSRVSWIGLPIALLGVGVIGFGVILEILAFTGGLPVWAIGRLDDEIDAGPA